MGASLLALAKSIYYLIISRPYVGVICFLFIRF